MSVEAIALLVAAIGFVGNLLVSVLTARATRRNEFVRELRTRTADAFKHVFVVQHAIEWVTWHAAHDRDTVTAKMKQDYNTEVHSAFPPLLGAVSAVAALDLGAFAKMQPILEELYALDERWAWPCAALSPPKQDALKQQNS